ncbi:MAG: translation elongation factor Ts [Wenzhouxiangellaceae bacterium]
MAVTAQLVKELRERTGAGMMECKKALVETDGDIEAAIEMLRKSGLAKADKKAGRVAAEGVIISAENADSGVLVEINSETDFVARDDSFQAFAKQVADAARQLGGDDIEALLAHKLDSGNDIETERQALISRIGENIQVRRMVRMNVAGDNLGSYVHGGRIGVLVHLQGGDSELANDLAMHIAAFAPAYIDADQVPAEVLDKEREILIAQAKDSGKPMEIIEKMVEGRLRKHLAEITLVGQPFVKDNDITIEKLLKDKNAKVIAYQRLMVGEGIEKEESNFAEEVMQQVRG